MFSLRGINPGPNGWKAADFAEGKDHIWAGMLRLNTNAQTNADENFLVLEHDPTDGKNGVFAMCAATKENIEPVNDSSRFFVLKISNNQGKYGFSCRSYMCM